MTAKRKVLIFVFIVLALGLVWGLVMEWDELTGHREDDQPSRSHSRLAK